MPPASRALPPSGLLSEGKDSPRAPLSASASRTGLAPARGYGGSVGVGHPFSGCRNGAAGKLFFKERRIGMPHPQPAPLTKVLGGRGMGVRGKGEGSPSPEGFPPPSPAYQNAICTTALPLSQRELSACASRKVSMHCQKPVWRYMESWPSAARRSSGSFSRSQDSSSER